MYKPNKAEQRAIEKRKEIALSLIELNDKGKKVLELGPGTGTLLFELKKKGFIVQGLDINPSLAKSNLNIKKGDINKKLPFTSESFDIIIALEVLEHTFNPFFVLKEMARVLKRDGYAIISMPNDYCIFHKLSFLFSRPPKKFDIYGHHYSLGIDQIKFLILKELKIEKEIPVLFFRKFTFLNPFARVLVKLNKSLFARNIFIKARKK
ncbi:MAG: class I SAM-dependent methyltransferase [Candidatus Pacearchaeota archaeon]